MSTTGQSASRIGVDIGGTFTDLVYFNSETGEISVEKVPTTPNNPEAGCVRAVKAAVPDAVLNEAEFFLHGTTVGLNALLERRGAKVGLLVTEGFRDVLAIGWGGREEYNLFWTPKKPLVPRHLRLPVRGRIIAGGEEISPLNESDILAALEAFKNEGVTSVAVCYLHAYANPAHELKTEQVLRDAGFGGPISLSHRLSGEYRDYERTSTTVIDAFVRSRMAGYLEHVEEELSNNGFGGTCLITRSGGGAMSFQDASERSFETIMSGPVGGAQGAAELSRHAELGDLVTADVGGTSFDTALIVDGRPEILYQGTIDGMPLQCPWVDVRSIGAGGGSIAYIDDGGLLQVGPRSAGAEPGPACYGRGGVEPTVSDAVFHLGMLGDGQLASGLVLNPELCRQAMEPIAKALGFTTREAACGIIRIAIAHMVGAMREITVEKGLDPRRLKLLAFGGAGPMLATELAREMGMREAIIPPYAGNFSAWGLLGADVSQNTSMTCLMPLNNKGLEAIKENAVELFSILSARAKGMNPAQTVKEVSLDLRFQGQEHTLTIPIPYQNEAPSVDADAVKKIFVDAYHKAFNNLLDHPIEIVTLRIALRQALPRRIENVLKNSGASPVPAQAVRAWSFAEGCEKDFPVLQRSSLPVAQEINGPAIILEPTATTYVDTDYNIFTNETGCMILRRQGAAS